MAGAVPNRNPIFTVVIPGVCKARFLSLGVRRVRRLYGLACLKRSLLRIRSDWKSELRTQGHCDFMRRFGSECRRIQIRQYGTSSIDEIYACQSGVSCAVGNDGSRRLSWMSRITVFIVRAVVSRVESIREEREFFVLEIERRWMFDVLRAWLASWSRVTVGWSI